MRSLVGNVEKCDRFWRCGGAIVFWGVGRRSFFENEGFGGAIVFGVVGMRSLFWDVEARSLCRMRREGAIVFWCGSAIVFGDVQVRSFLVNFPPMTNPNNND
jgi:hypothetical protein